MMKRSFKQYIITRELGSGAMGTVFLASDRVTGRLAAVKTIHLKSGTDLRKEFLLLSPLRHPYLCTMLDFGYSGPGKRAPYLVREFVPGNDLLSHAEPFSHDMLEEIARQALQAISYLHGRNIIHGDIKPDNILLTPAGHIKLIDFHLAFCLETGTDDPAGHFGGTLPYLHPDRLSGRRNTPLQSDDLFALGVTLFQLAAGTLPAPARTREDIAAWYRDRGIPRLSAITPGVPAAFDRLVARLTSLDQAEVFSSARKALHSLPEASEAASLSTTWPRLIGRHKESIFLSRTCIDAIKKGAPQVVFVTGAAGSGKTRLLNEAIYRIKASGIPVYAFWEPQDDPLHALYHQVREESDAQTSGAETDYAGSLIASFRTDSACVVMDAVDSGKLKDFLVRVSLHSNLKLLVLLSDAHGRGRPKPEGNGFTTIKLEGLSRSDTEQLVCDYLCCETVDSALSEELWQQTGGLPGPLLLLLAQAVDNRSVAVNEAGIVHATGPLPPLPAQKTAIPERFTRLFDSIDLAGGALKRTVLQEVLGPGSAELVDEAFERGLIVELNASNEPSEEQGKLVSRAWGVFPEESAETPRRYLSLRLACSFRRHSEFALCSKQLFDAGCIEAGIRYARKAFFSLRIKDPKRAVTALRQVLAHTRPREKILDGLRVNKYCLQAGMLDVCSEALQQIELGVNDVIRRKSRPSSRILSVLFTVQKALFLQRSGKKEEALELVASSVRTARGLPFLRTVVCELCALQGTLSFQLKRQEAALGCFSSVEASPPPPPGSICSRFWHRAQVEAAVGLGLLGFSDRAEALIDRLLADVHLPPALRLKPLGEKAIRAAEKGDRDNARTAFRDIASTACEIGDRETEIKAVVNQAILAYKNRKLTEAKQCFQRGLKLSFQRGEIMLRPAIWCGLATVQRVHGNFREAVQNFWNVLRLPNVQPGFSINAACNLGEVYHLLGAGRKAIQLRTRALEEAAALGDEYLRMLTTFGAAATQWFLGAGDAALDKEAEALAVKRNEKDIASGLAFFRGVGAESGPDPGRTIAVFERGVERASEAGNRDYETACRLGLIRSLLRMKNMEKSRAVFREIENSTQHARQSSWEVREEIKIWGCYFAGLQGAVKRAVLSLAGMKRDLAQCPPLEALALLIAAGFLRNKQYGHRYAWIPFFIEGADLLDRLEELGARACAQRVQHLVETLFPALFDVGALPWSGIVGSFHRETHMELFLKRGNRFLLLHRSGKRGRRARSLAASCSARRGEEKQADMSPCRLLSLLQGRAAAVLYGASAPQQGLLTSLVQTAGMCFDLEPMVLAHLAPPRAVQQGSASQMETDVIQSRAEAVKAVRLLQHTEQEDDCRFAGQSSAISAIMTQLPRITQSDLPVLITGESGTGKDLIARLIHTMKGAERPFVPLHCGSIPDQLQETELFGAAKGAFTGADSDRAGLLERANGGTLYLDGLGTFGGTLQSKMLRVLEEREVRAVGSSVRQHIRFHLITASRLGLDRLKAYLREDFFYRISGFILNLPPLRERTEDIPVIIEELLRRWSLKQGRKAPAIHEDTMAYLSQHLWPGNVRELENTLHRALLSGKKELKPNDIQLERLPTQGEAEETPSVHRTLQSVREEAEKQYLAALLDAHQEQIGKSAEQAGISRRHLSTLLKKYGLRR